MIGTIVTWNRFDEAGKPTRAVSGEVVSVGFHDYQFRLLIKTPSGELLTVEAVDVKVIDLNAPIIVTEEKKSPKKGKSLLEKAPQAEEEPALK